jgi:hypothetical protein
MRCISILFFGLLFILNSCDSEQILQLVAPSIEQRDMKMLSLDSLKVKEKAQEAFEFCEKNKYNTSFCILIDMSVHSGLNRFVVWDFKTNSIDRKMLVSHGCCDNAWTSDQSKENPTFSNVDGSHCSSLGKYLIGERGVSQFGVKIKYLLHGLDESNKNALKRAIVFHSWELIPNEEVYPTGTPEGWGCPAISDAHFLELDKILKPEKKVLMWIFN